MILEAYLLAGGKSSRMGEDKGLKKLVGIPLIEYSLEVLKLCFPIIKINSENQQYLEYGYPLISDIFKEKGPMGGIYSCLKDSSDDIFIVSCDSPFVTVSAIKYLLKRHKKGAVTIASYQGDCYPLLGIYSKKSINLLENNIKRKQLKMQTFLQEIKANYVEMENIVDKKVFKNINTLQEFSTIENLMQT